MVIGIVVSLPCESDAAFPLLLHRIGLPLESRMALYPRHSLSIEQMYFCCLVLDVVKGVWDG